MTFTIEPLYTIFEYAQEELEKHGEVSFEVINPDIEEHLYSGEIVKLDKDYIYRSYRVWNDFANILFSKMFTPIITRSNTIILRFKKIELKSNFHKNSQENLDDKYGINSDFSRINKNEEISFLYYYTQALKNVKIEDKHNILNLGINKGDEFAIIQKLLKNNIKDKNFIGIDISKTAIEYAKTKFNSKNFSFLEHDITKLNELNIKKSDLIISIGTLQSTNLNFKEVFMSLIQNQLEEKGSIILGFPNCRWIDGEVIYGAKAPNYSYSEQSILYKDVYFCKKYLQQKKYRVTLTGKDYLFLTATSIKK